MRYVELTAPTDKLLFLGDVLPYHSPDKPIKHETPFILNLEAPFVEHGRPIPGKINLKTSRLFMEDLFSPQPIAVSLANNHVLDYGNEGFEQTLHGLKDMNIDYFGAGAPEDNYNNPLILVINSLRVALFGYCYAYYYDQIAQVEGLKYGPAPLIPDRIKNDIAMVRDSVDIVVLQLHWGTLYSNFPTKEEVCIARDLVDLGADIIIGHHCHTIQPIEVYNGSIIAYGLGNYLFPDLDLPSYYDHSGVATRKKVQKQRGWSRSSGGLLVDMKTKDHSVKYFTLKDNVVMEKKKFFHRYLSWPLPENLDTLQPRIDRNVKTKQYLRRLLEIMEDSWRQSKTMTRQIVHRGRIDAS